MKIEDAFQLFRSRLSKAGIGVPHDRSRSGAFGTRYSEIILYDGKFRLVFNGRDSMLTLDISHGPPGARAGWLDLYRAKCTKDEFLEADGKNLSFEQAVVYGIEVLAPTV
jgi:hypothetical protein